MTYHRVVIYLTESKPKCRSNVCFEAISKQFTVSSIAVKVSVTLAGTRELKKNIKEGW